MAEANDQPIMPEFHILRSPVDIVCGCLGRFAMLPSTSEPCLSEHHTEPPVASEDIVDDPEYQDNFGF